ncbi:MAG: hypothetical protein HKN26_04475 [Acidimicrobiales bacterium]|nr:hypothetical protein [Acidimicrobiales bacterium]
MVDIDPEAAATLHGAAPQLLAVDPSVVSDQSHEQPRDPDAAPRSSGKSAVLTGLRRATSLSLSASLGEARFRTLVATGRTMGREEAIGFALDAMAHARLMAS